MGTGKAVILTTTGCYGTGSSAVTDLLMEFEGISCVSNNEIRILHDPDGISDLEYNLIENPNRHNTSHSIKKFKKRMKELDHIWFIQRFSRYFGRGFLKAVDKYIDSITEMSYHGMWHYDVYDRGKMFYLVSQTVMKTSMFLGKIFHTAPSAWGLIPKKELAYLGITDEEAFLAATRKFMDDIGKLAFGENSQYVFYDQLVPPSGFSRYIRYVNDIRIILVERDPRDIYLMEKAVWGGGVAPVDRADDFCRWYRWTRNLYEREPFPEEVILIRFEDLIYHYEETKQRIVNHFGIGHLEHRWKKKHFDPNVSVNNTHIWDKIKGCEHEINLISRELPEYCYDFDSVNFKAADKRLIFF